MIATGELSYCFVLQFSESLGYLGVGGCAGEFPTIGSNCSESDAGGVDLSPGRWTQATS